MLLKFGRHFQNKEALAEKGIRIIKHILIRFKPILWYYMLLWRYRHHIDDCRQCSGCYVMSTIISLYDDDDKAPHILFYACWRLPPSPVEGRTVWEFDTGVRD